MSISNKYNIPAETVSKMVRDGIIPCSRIMYEEIYLMFQTEISSGVASMQAYCNISEKKGISERTVRHIVSMGKAGKI